MDNERSHFIHGKWNPAFSVLALIKTWCPLSHPNNNMKNYVIWSKRLKVDFILCTIFSIIVNGKLILFIILSFHMEVWCSEINRRHLMKESEFSATYNCGCTSLWVASAGWTCPHYPQFSHLNIPWDVIWFSSYTHL